MESVAHQEVIGADYATATTWRTVAEALAEELAAMRSHLATVERLLALSVPPIMLARCVRQSGRAERRYSSADCSDAQPVLSPTDTGDGLSHREVDVLRLLATGHSNRRIAATLYLSPRTVQRHVANVYLKIGAHCRAEATVYALRHGLA